MKKKPVQKAAKKATKKTAKGKGFSKPAAKAVKKKTAKKPVSKPATVSEPPKTLTLPQLEELASSLLGTTLNVYQLCERKFGVEADDSTFEQLAALEDGIFRCENCNEWQSVAARGVGDICNDCIDHIDGVGDDLDD